MVEQPSAGLPAEIIRRSAGGKPIRVAGRYVDLVQLARRFQDHLRDTGRSRELKQNRCDRVTPRCAVQGLNQRLDGFFGALLRCESGPFMQPRAGAVFRRLQIPLRLFEPVC